MSITVRFTGADDRETVAMLLHRVDQHYWGERAPTLEEMRRHVRGAVMSPESQCQVVIAEQGQAAVGLATFAIVYPAYRLAGHLHMKDLFTVDEARGLGVGEALMRFLARHAVDRGCSRFDWTTERGNPGAMAFYDRMGARRVEEKVYYRLEGAALSRLAD